MAWRVWVVEWWKMGANIIGLDQTSLHKLFMNSRYARESEGIEEQVERSWCEAKILINCLWTSIMGLFTLTMVNIRAGNSLFQRHHIRTIIVTNIDDLGALKLQQGGAHLGYFQVTRLRRWLYRDYPKERMARCSCCGDGVMKENAQTMHKTISNSFAQAALDAPVVALVSDGYRCRVARTFSCCMAFWPRLLRGGEAIYPCLQRFRDWRLLDVLR